MKKIFSLALVLLMAATGVRAAEQATVDDYLSNGWFSVNKVMAVRLAKSNMIYYQKDDRMDFAPHAFNVIGEHNLDVGTSNADVHAIDLFCWGATGYNGTPKPTVWNKDDDAYATWMEGTDFHKSFTNSQHFLIYPDTLDWAYAYPVAGFQKGTFRTMSMEEWSYLLFERPNAKELKGLAKVAGVYGLIILPDKWHTPYDLEFKPYHTLTYEGESWEEAYYTDNVYSMPEWDLMEEAGAVFLPEGGCRWFITLNAPGRPQEKRYYTGFKYWTSSCDPAANNPQERDYRAKSFYLVGSILKGGDVNKLAEFSNTPRSQALSVRLTENSAIRKSDIKEIDGGTINLMLENGKATWNGYTFTKPGTFYYTEKGSDIYTHKVYTIVVTAPDPYYEVKVQFLLDWNYTTQEASRKADTWDSPSRLMEYASMETTPANLMTQTVKVKKGTKVSFSNFQSDYFKPTYYDAGDADKQKGPLYNLSDLENVSITVNEDMLINVELTPECLIPEGGTNDVTMGTAGCSTTGLTCAPLSITERPDRYPEDWRLWYKAYSEPDADFVAWVPAVEYEKANGDVTSFLNQQAFVLVLLALSGNTDNPLGNFIAKCYQKEFSISPSEFEEFVRYCGVTYSGENNTPHLKMIALFQPKEKINVFIDSPHGEVYDEMGNELDVKPGGDKFFSVLEYTKLRLNIKDIDVDWRFDHWEVDGQNVGNKRPLEIIVEKKETAQVVKAVYEERGSRFVVVARRKKGDNWYYMTGDVPSSGTKRYPAVSTGKTNIAEIPTTNLEASYYWSLNENKYLLNGDNFSYHQGGNTADLNNKKDKATVLTIADGENGGYTFSYEASDATRYLSLNKTTGQDFFAYYKAGQIAELYLIDEGHVATAIDEIVSDKVQGIKVLRDGQLFIIRDGKIYNAQGAEVR